MPHVLALLSIVGTLAMLWVGGGIVIHGLAVFGVEAPEAGIHHLATAVGGGLPGWLASAAVAGLVGLALGGLATVLGKYGLAPLVALWNSMRRSS
jgi:hypothetical protein